MPSVPITVKPSVVNSEKTSSRLRAANVSNACRRSADTSLVVAAVKPRERVISESSPKSTLSTWPTHAGRLLHVTTCTTASSTLASAVGCREGCK